MNMMKSTVKILIVVVALMGFSGAAMGAVATNQWTMDGDATDSVGSNNGSLQGVGHVTWSATTVDSFIYDPLSTSYRANAGSALMDDDGDWTSTGWNVASVTALDSFWKPYTIEAIVKAPSGQADESFIFCRRQNSHPSGVPNYSILTQLGFGQQQSDQALGVFGVGNAYPSFGNMFPKSSADSFQDNEWHHVAMTYSFSGINWVSGGYDPSSDPAPEFTMTMELWLDYVKVDTESLTRSAFLEKDPDSNAHLPSTAPGYIAGGYGRPTADFYLDELRILDYAVTADPLDHFLQASSVPEPVTLSILALGGMAVLLRRRR